MNSVDCPNIAKNPHYGGYGGHFVKWFQKIKPLRFRQKKTGLNPVEKIVQCFLIFCVCVVPVLECLWHFLSQARFHTLTDLPICVSLLIENGIEFRNYAHELTSSKLMLCWASKTASQSELKFSSSVGGRSRSAADEKMSVSKSYCSDVRVTWNWSVIFIFL